MRFDGLPNKRLSLRKQDYYYLGHYTWPLLYAGLSQDWADTQEVYSGLPRVSGQIFALDGRLYISLYDWTVITQGTIRALDSRDLDYFEKYLSISEKITGSVVKFIEIRGETNLREDLKELFEVTHELEYPWWYILPMASAVEEWLASRIPSNVLPSFFEPDRETPMMKYQKLLKTISTISDQKKKEREIESAAEEFRWVGMMHYWGNPNSAQKIKESLNGESGQTVVLDSQTAFEDRLSWLLPYTRALTFYRQYFAELCAMLSLRLYDLLEGNDISRDSTLWYSPQELLNRVDSNIILDKKVLQKREYGFALANGFVTGKDLQKLIDDFVEKIPDVSELHGTSASKGCARGNVKIVRYPDDVNKVREGDILVSHETTPDLVPAMRRASAIVTDIGGLTSHAAIVSRELNKPCVIGTKIGTRILKDGDLVEVDANDGIVKIIKKNHES